MPTGPLLNPVNRNLLQPGNHPATVIGAEMTRNHNGKLNLELDLDLGNRRIQHNMYCTTEASTANTARQLKAAFGVTSFKDVAGIVGKSCSLRIEHEEYNGRTQAKVSYVNPHGSTAATDVDFTDLDAGFTAKKEVEIAF